MPIHSAHRPHCVGPNRQPDAPDNIRTTPMLWITVAGGCEGRRIGAMHSKPPPPVGRTTRAERAARVRAERAERHELAQRLAVDHDGVVTRQALIKAGISREHIRLEVERGVWHRVGWHTLSIDGLKPRGRGLWWRALWEAGGRSVLDGATSLLAAGLTGWQEDVIHVSVPVDTRVRPIDGVEHHHVRLIGDITGAALRRTKSEIAVVRAAQWARTDRQAATLIAMAVQQRLARPEDVLARWEGVLHTNRRPFLDAVIRDVCAGAHSLSELDFARLCREHGLPEPSRQVLRPGERGNAYLDVYWDELGIHVEIQGAGHYQGLAIIDDALRFNALTLNDDELESFQVPVLGLRICPERFMAQIERAIRRKQRRLRSA